MSKKDEAFELFSQGKLPGEPEIVVLGLTDSTVNKYFRQWQIEVQEHAASPKDPTLTEDQLALPPEPEEKPAEEEQEEILPGTPLSSCYPAQDVLYNGQEWRVKALTVEMVVLKKVEAGVEKSISTTVPATTLVDLI